MTADDAALSTVGEVLSRLVQLRTLAGSPSYRRMQSLTARGTVQAVPHSTLGDTFTGKRAIRWRELEAVVVALLQQARRDGVAVPEELTSLERWKAVWQEEEHRRAARRTRRPAKASGPGDAVMQEVSRQREELRNLARRNPLIAAPEFDDPTCALPQADPFEMLLKELRALPVGAGTIEALARDPWPSPRDFVPTLFARGLLTEEEAERLVAAAAYRSVREVQDIAVRLADTDPDLVRHYLLFSFGAVRDESAVVELLSALRAIPTGVWRDVDVVAAVCAGFASTRRPDALAAFIQAAGTLDDRELRDALTAAGAVYGSPADTAELLRILALGHDPGLAVVVLERVACEDAPEWIDLVLQELERWNALGEAAYLRHRLAGIPPKKALWEARQLPWTMRWGTQRQALDTPDPAERNRPTRNGSHESAPGAPPTG